MTATARQDLFEKDSDSADQEEGDQISTNDGDEESKNEDEGEIGELDDDEAEALKKDLGSDIRQGKRRRAVGEDKEEGRGENSKDKPSTSSEDVWKAIQTDKAAASNTADRKEEMIRVIRTFRFAGEEVKEEKMLPASDPEAKAFLLAEAKKNDQKSNGAILTSSSVSSPTVPPRAPPISGGPRKRKMGGLAAMSAAATSKPAKINTLEKSKMDWTKFKDTELGDAEKHQLDAQTKGGSSGLGSMKGYMERRNFLERVQDRLEGPSQGK